MCKYLHIYILKSADVATFLGVCEHRVAFSQRVHFELAAHQVYMTTRSREDPRIIPNNMDNEGKDVVDDGKKSPIIRRRRKLFGNEDKKYNTNDKTDNNKDKKKNDKEAKIDIKMDTKKKDKEDESEDEIPASRRGNQFGKGQ